MVVPESSEVWEVLEPVTVPVVVPPRFSDVPELDPLVVPAVPVVPALDPVELLVAAVVVTPSVHPF